MADEAGTGGGREDRGTVLVTGPTGRVGPAVVARLNEAGYRTVGVARSGGPADGPADRYLRGDSREPGDVYGALERTDPDAVVHLGTLSSPRGTPGHVTFESQTRSTYLVCEAAGAVDVDRVVVASSLAALGTSFGGGQVQVDYLPVDETHPTRPRDPYGVGKRAAEEAAAGVARRSDAPDVVSLRFPYVLDPDTLEREFRDPDRTLSGLREADVFAVARDTLFTWLHLDDATRAVHRSLEAPVSGHETVFLAAADTTVDDPTERVIAECYPDAERRRSFSGRESLLDCSKAERLLDWTPTVERVDAT